MVKKIFTCIFLIIISLVINITYINANSSFLEVSLNGKKIKHMYTNKPVLMPKEYIPSVSEMRGVWVATVWNNDIPKQNGTSEEDINNYKLEFLKILDTLETYNLNTIFFQVRPCNDAFYESDYNDYSEFLVGKGIHPNWDPLEWMVSETHKRGMYFQCWMNAFRVTTNELLDKDASLYTTDELLLAKKNAISNLSDKNFAKLNPDTVLLGEKDSKLILDPANLLVHEHILNTIEELITKYDVDGCHFDDYFYLSPASRDLIDPQTTNLSFAGGTTFNSNLTGVNTLNDLPTYSDYLNNPEKYNLEENLPLGEFRRQSLNNLMKKIRTLVDKVNIEYNKNVEFGSKPTAVWQSNKEYCLDSSSRVNGSNTHCGAYNSNYTLFADTKTWVESGFVDYIAPQVYFGFESQEVPYADIVSWWADVVTKTNEKRTIDGLKPIKMYVAHGIYKYHEGVNEYKDPLEIEYQLRYNQNFECIKGSAFYAYKDLVEFKNNVHKSGINKLYLLYKNNPVLPLPNTSFDYNNLKVSDIIIKETTTSDTYNISFNKSNDISNYQIYRVKDDIVFNNDTKYRIDIIKSYKYSDKISFNLKKYDGYDYYIQAVSNNLHPSSEVTKINFDECIINTKPTTTTIRFDKTVYDIKDTINIYIDYAQDIDNDDLTYDISVSFNGIEGPFNYKVSDVEYLNDYIKCSFKNFGVSSNSFCVKVVVSDTLSESITYSDYLTFLDSNINNNTNTNNTTNNTSSCNMFSSVFSIILLGIIILIKKS